MEIRNCLKEVLLFTAMVALEFTNVGLTTLYKAANSRGMSNYVFLLYTCAIATLHSSAASIIQVPSLLKNMHPWPYWVLSQMLGYKGIEYSSPTLASAISNPTPAFTFIFAVIFRMEKLALRSMSTPAKVIGTIVSIAGALVVVLYKGPAIFSTSPFTDIASLQLPLGSSQTNWILGGLLHIADYLLLSNWYIVQTQVLKIYPAELVTVFLYNLCATVITVPVCFMAEKDTSAWRLKPDRALVSIIYAGCTGSSFNTVAHSCGLHSKGPVYAAIFKPLSIAIAAITRFIFLGDALHLGTVIGAIILGIGFYAVIWGKAKEEGIDDDTGFTSLGYGDLKSYVD